MYLYLLALLPLIAAQNSTVYPVDVGEGGLIFTPNTLTASVGDQVQFSFYPQNHSVAQSTFENPCNPLSNAIFSGFMPVANGTASEVFTITINSTKTLWLYCSQGRHCQSGMAMVINPSPNGNASISAYQTAARSVANNVSPPSIQGGAISAASSVRSNSTSTGSGNGTSTGRTTPTAGSPSASSTSSSGTSSGGGYVAKSADWMIMGAAGVAALIFGGLLM